MPCTGEGRGLQGPQRSPLASPPPKDASDSGSEDETTMPGERPRSSGRLVPAAVHRPLSLHPDASKRRLLWIQLGKGRAAKRGLQQLLSPL